MWVAESERQVRDFCDGAEKRREGFMPLFSSMSGIDFGHAPRSRYSKFCHACPDVLFRKMDEHRVADDRRDYPRFQSRRFDRSGDLATGRIDRKVKVNRPNREGARDVYRIYLTDDLPTTGCSARSREHWRSHHAFDRAPSSTGSSPNARRTSSLK